MTARRVLCVPGIQHRELQLKCSSAVVVSSAGTFTRAQAKQDHPEMEIRKWFSSALPCSRVR